MKGSGSGFGIATFAILCPRVVFGSFLFELQVWWSVTLDDLRMWYNVMDQFLHFTRFLDLETSKSRRSCGQIHQEWTVHPSHYARTHELSAKHDKQVWICKANIWCVHITYIIYVCINTYIYIYILWLLWSHLYTPVIITCRIHLHNIHLYHN